MKQRYDRLETLRIILSRGEAGSQESILRQLTHMGFDVTQATLSRDLRKLKAVKVPYGDSYRYILPEHPHYQRNTQPPRSQTFCVQRVSNRWRFQAIWPLSTRVRATPEVWLPTSMPAACLRWLAPSLVTMPS